MRSSEGILVVGMGRSGTSAISSSLVRLGFFGGVEQELIQGDEGNPEGYFELGSFALLNDRLRTILGMKFNPCLACPADWREYENIALEIAELKSLIQSTFGNHRHWVLKDPRLTLLLPIYEAVLSGLGARAALVICVRNPLNAAESFHRRFGIPETWAIGMWLQHTLMALEASPRFRRRVVCYEDYLADPVAALRPVLDPFPEIQPPEDTWNDLARSQKPHLNHGKFERADLKAIRPNAIVRVFDLCREAAADPRAFESGLFNSEISDVSAEFESWWTLPPYEKLLASVIRLTYSVDGVSVAREAMYVPKRKPQTIEIEIEAPRGAPVEVQLSAGPCILLLRNVRLTNASGQTSPLTFDRASDISSAPHREGEIWTIPRSGNHLRFIATGGKCVFAISFSAIADPVETARFASESWMECLALRGKIAELESILRERSNTPKAT